MAAIGASVGKGGANNPADVQTVQQLLNLFLAVEEQPLLAVTGSLDKKTAQAIVFYQGTALGFAAPDGLIDPAGKTWAGLSAGAGMKPKYSGADWWHAWQQLFPAANALNELAEPFRTGVRGFLKALREADAEVTVRLTRRHPAREKLMHYSWRIAKEGLPAFAVPPIAMCPIKWAHPNGARDVPAAQEMVALFGLTAPPPLATLHAEGLAIEVRILWTGTIAVADAKGKVHPLGEPGNGGSNAVLHAIGASYGVFKVKDNPSRWSATGK